MRTKSHPKKLSVYLSLSNVSIDKYYNPNDPAPLQYRQLSYEFHDYLEASVAAAGRHTRINYKFFCANSSGMNFLVDPLIKSIRRHYQVKADLAEAQFRRFKKRNYILLFIGILVVMIFQGLLPWVSRELLRNQFSLNNALDVFSWVILWKPIERLIFYWNPYLKEINLFKRMETAEMILIDNEEELINYHLEHFNAA